MKRLRLEELAGEIAAELAPPTGGGRAGEGAGGGASGGGGGRMGDPGGQIGDRPVSPDLDENVTLIKALLNPSDDIVFREISIGHEQHIRAEIVFIDGIVDKSTIHEHVMKSLMLHTERIFPAPPRGKGLGDVIKEFSLTVGEVKTSTKMGDVIDAVLNSDTALFIDGVPICYIVNTKGWEHRSVQEPNIESAVRGAREGFNEVLRTTTALVRRRIKDSRLRVKQMRLGRRTKTDIAVIYLEGVANEQIVAEVFSRLRDIDVDAVLDTGHLEQLIEDNPYSPFPQMQATERTDKVGASILEGKVAIACDTTPFVLLAPATLWAFYQTSDDYFERWIIATFVRALRFLALVTALVLPSLYVSLVAFHPEMIPAKIALPLAGIRSGLPFNAVLELLILELSVETLREASVRLPGPIGPTIGIVGAIVIGEAAIRAGLVGPLAVILVATTTIASFVSPSYSAGIAVRVLRFPLIALAAMLGLVGVMVGIIAISIHVCGLDSFGVPYLSPIVPLTTGDLKDTAVRLPLWAMKMRPLHLRPVDVRRMAQSVSALETGRAAKRIDLGQPASDRDKGAGEGAGGPGGGSGQ
ncbi:MAG: spore germination protein [Firmicutes bacterium]|nr:spore germination protein [Bacillota bacterium]